MGTKMPTDSNNKPIPVLGFLTGGSHKVSFTATSARNSVPFNAATRVITVFATQDCLVRTGNSSVAAVTTDHFVKAGIYLDIAVDGQSTEKKTHAAAIRSSADGDLYISERE